MCELLHKLLVWLSQLLPTGKGDRRSRARRPGKIDLRAVVGQAMMEVGSNPQSGGEHVHRESQVNP